MKKHLYAVICSLLCFTNSHAQSLAYTTVNTAVFTPLSESNIAIHPVGSIKNLRLQSYRSPASDKASLLMLGGVALAAGGAAIMLINHDPTSKTYGEGQGALFLGGVFFAVGGVIDLVLHASGGNRYGVISKKNEMGLAYTFK